MTIPKQVVRVTKNNLHQLYQPGFNNSNSCWLTGRWITIPKDEWNTRKKEHVLMYKNVGEEQSKQHHRNKGTSLKNMTKAQKQAWEFLSGSETFDCYRLEEFLVNHADHHLIFDSNDFHER